VFTRCGFGLNSQCSALCLSLNLSPLSKRQRLESQRLVPTKGPRLNPAEGGKDLLPPQALDVRLSAGREASVHLSGLVVWHKHARHAHPFAYWAIVCQRARMAMSLVTRSCQHPGVVLAGGFPWSSSRSCLGVLLSAWRNPL